MTTPGYLSGLKTPLPNTQKMKQAIKILIYFLSLSVILWFAFVAVAYLITFSYSDNLIARILYYLLFNWVPGKLYGLTLFHAIICVFLTFLIIGFFDHLLTLNPKARKSILILIALLFLYEAFANFFMQKDQELLIPQFRQQALLQVSFIIGILIKTFHLDT
jgi:hypothetical protein